MDSVLEVSMFSNEELDLIGAALEQLDHFHQGLMKVQGLAGAGVDEARGKSFLLLAKVRRYRAAKPAAVLAPEAETK